MVWSFWTMLVNIALSHSSALHIKLTVVTILPLGNGTFPMKLKSQILVICGSSTPAEVLVWFVCTAGQAEWLDSTTARYHVKMSSILFMLEFIQPVQVSTANGCHVKLLWVFSLLLQVCPTQPPSSSSWHPSWIPPFQHSLSPAPPLVVLLPLSPGQPTITQSLRTVPTTSHLRYWEIQWRLPTATLWWWPGDGQDSTSVMYPTTSRPHQAGAWW